jgi:redox-sensitive bicupin YhaK (pirin superfamily)
MNPTLIEPHLRDLGGFAVRRLLPSFPHKTIGPFIFFDHFGPTEFAPGAGVDVRPHPHIGLATVSYLFEGALMHRDSLGTVQRIEAGDVNWMTAGRGIVHSERTPAEERAAGHRIHGLQTWVALPLAREDAPPAFTHVPRSSLPFETRGGVKVTVVAGSAFGIEAPTPVASGTLYAAVDMEPGATLTIPAEHEQRAVYAIDEGLSIDGTPVPASRMAVLGDGEVVLRAEQGARAMLVGGARVDGERIIWWNFVASSKERIEQAKERWRAQEFGSVRGETDFIPLPDR